MIILVKTFFTDSVSRMNLCKAGYCTKFSCIYLLYRRKSGSMIDTKFIHFFFCLCPIRKQDIDLFPRMKNSGLYLQKGNSFLSCVVPNLPYCRCKIPIILFGTGNLIQSSKETVNPLILQSRTLETRKQPALLYQFLQSMTPQ